MLIILSSLSILKKRRLAASSFINILYIIFFATRVCWHIGMTIYMVINNSCIARYNMRNFMANITMTNRLLWAFPYWWTNYSWNIFSHYTRHTHITCFWIKILSFPFLLIFIFFGCITITIIIYFQDNHFPFLVYLMKE